MVETVFLRLVPVFFSIQTLLLSLSNMRRCIIDPSTCFESSLIKNKETNLKQARFSVFDNYVSLNIFFSFRSNKIAPFYCFFHAKSTVIFCLCCCDQLIENCLNEHFRHFSNNNRKITYVLGVCRK